MDAAEAKAYWVCKLWLDLCKKHFPKYHYAKLKQGDPRKSNLFKYCYKFVREMEGILKEEEYKLFIAAQLQVLKSLSDGDVHIDPQILVGKKAWNRWKFWKKYYDKLELNNEKETIISDTQINIEIENSKQFIIEKFGKELNEEDIKANLPKLLEYVKKDKISKYYIKNNPLFNKPEIIELISN